MFDGYIYSDMAIKKIICLQKTSERNLYILLGRYVKMYTYIAT